jgi:serine/threonine protein kinase
MGTGDESPKTPNTDNQETSVLGKAPVTSGGTLLNGRYLLVRQLNAGGFGTVHLAHDQQMHGRPVVVKIQINQRVDDPWFERKFSEEVRALSLLDHPGVVVAFDSGRTVDGMPFLVMQYVEGVTLREVMTPEGMPLERAAGILKQLGTALAAAHEKGIWHRDLKPENVMLQTSAGGEDRVRLIDFGIATVADVKSKYQTSTRVAGSVLYMAPEQNLGQPTALSDIYAMGLIAYEMVTGRRPFPADNAIQMITLQQLPVRVKPSDLRPSLPLAAEQLILQSLEVDPARRPQKARVFGDQLHNALMTPSQPIAFHTSSAPPPISAAVPAPAAKRNRKPLALAIAGIAILAGVYRDWRKPAVEERKSPVVQDTKASPDDSIELTFWNSVKDSTEPQLYREYLAKYPDGRFASLANAKIQILSRKENPPPAIAKAALPKTAPPAKQEGPEQTLWNLVKDTSDLKLFEGYLEKYPNGEHASEAKERIAALTPPPQPPGPNSRRTLPPPRPSVDLAKYAGPREGEIHWSGRVLKNTGMMIQGGEVNIGTISGDLPRVPVKIELVGSQATLVALPTERNHWDHIAVRNLSGGPMKNLVIRWKVVK